MSKFVVYALAMILCVTISSGETYADLPDLKAMPWMTMLLLSETSDAGWVRLLGTESSDLGGDIALDSKGNSYIQGYYGVGDLGLRDDLVAKYNKEGNLQWVRLNSTPADDTGGGIAADSNGNSYVCGHTRGDLDGNTNNGSWDIFIIKYDTNGNKAWLKAKLLGSPAADGCLSLALDSSGNSYITGFTYGDLDPEDGKPNAGSSDIFIAKYDTDGKFEWARQLATAGEDSGRNIAVDSNGNSYVCGYACGELDGETYMGGCDIVIAKYDTHGVKKCVTLLGTPDFDGGYGIDLDSSGKRIYITGGSYGELDGKSNMGSEDIFVAEYDTECNKVCTILHGTPEWDRTNAIVVDLNGNGYATGYTWGNLDGNSNKGPPDIFIAKYKPGCVKQWVTMLGTPEYEAAYDIALDSNGNSYVTGETSGDLGGQPNEGGSDAYVWKLVDPDK
jgi:hypothetical protein